MPTWTGATTSYSVATNWSGGLPTNTTDAIFDGAVSNLNCVVNIINLVCFNFTIQNGYTGTITFTNTLTVRGSITFIASVFFAGPNGIVGQSLTNTAVTYNSNNKPFNLPFSVSHNSIVITFVNTWTVSNFTVNAVSGNSVVYTGGTVNVTGNLTNGQNSAVSTTQFVLTGTGIFSSPARNWCSPTEINSPSGTITLDSVLLAGGCIFSYNPLSLNNIVASPGNITVQVGNSVTLNLQNQAIGSLSVGYNSTLALLSNANVLNATFGSGGGTNVNLVGAGLRVNIRGNLNIGQTGGQLAGTGILTLTGSGTISSAVPSLGSINSGIGVDLELNTSGPYTATSNMSLTTGGKTFTRTNGTINWSTFTLFINSSWTLNTAGITFNNISVYTFTIYTTTINSLLTIAGNLTLNGATIFAGSFGWTCANLICSTAGSFNITLQQAVAYRTTAGVSITGGTALARPTMRSSLTGTDAIWTLDSGATQSLIYVNGIDIDSSGGQTIWSFGVLITDVNTSINWNPGVPLRTVAYTFVT